MFLYLRNTDRKVPSRHANVVNTFIFSVGDPRAGRRAQAGAARETSAGATQLARGRPRRTLPAQVSH